MGCCASSDLNGRDAAKESHVGTVASAGLPCDASSVPELLAVVALDSVSPVGGEGDANVSNYLDKDNSSIEERNPTRADSTQIRFPETDLNDKERQAPAATSHAAHERLNAPMRTALPPQGQAAGNGAVSCPFDRLSSNISAESALEPAQHTVPNQKQCTHNTAVRNSATGDDCSVQQSQEDEIWARLEQRMSSPANVGTRLCKQHCEAEHVFVTTNVHGDGHLQIQQQNSTDQEHSNCRPVKRTVVSGCWGGTKELAQAGEVMRTQFTNFELHAQDESDDEQENVLLHSQVDTLDIAIDDL